MKLSYSGVLDVCGVFGCFFLVACNSSSDDGNEASRSNSSRTNATAPEITGVRDISRNRADVTGIVKWDNITSRCRRNILYRISIAEYLYANSQH